MEGNKSLNKNVSVLKVEDIYILIVRGNLIAIYALKPLGKVIYINLAVVGLYVSVVSANCVKFGTCNKGVCICFFNSCTGCSIVDVVVTVNKDNNIAVINKVSVTRLLCIFNNKSSVGSIVGIFRHFFIVIIANSGRNLNAAYLFNNESNKLAVICKVVKLNIYLIILFVRGVFLGGVGVKNLVCSCIVNLADVYILGLFGLCGCCGLCGLLCFVNLIYHFCLGCFDFLGVLDEIYKTVFSVSEFFFANLNSCGDCIFRYCKCYNIAKCCGVGNSGYNHIHCLFFSGNLLYDCDNCCAANIASSISIRINAGFTNLNFTVAAGSKY